ncbi:50S ribosomal protein L30e [Caldivirga sp.]|uniref:50S ribosomal protein L30e n=1 Tax=Caldivirga sp. TaxID=2080243 RepID=UPI0025B98AEB|nr:50S ribosomal protein L30e [Caldivirga sp.]
MIDISRELQVVANTGRLTMGVKQSIKAILNGDAKLVIMAANVPPSIKQDVERYAKLSQVPIFTYAGTSWELGGALRRSHKIAVVAIIDPGESSIMSLAGGGNV